jgi:hypothetical protein
MKCFGFGFNNLKTIPLAGTFNEFLNLLFQIPKHPIPKVLKQNFQILNYPILGSPKHIFNQVLPTYTYIEVGDSICIRAIELI